MSERISIGLIGCGLIAQGMHLPSLRRLSDRFELRAIADPSAEVRAALGAEYGVATHAEWRDLLAEERIDAVVVSSPDATHVDVTLAALAAGCHVFVEKPLCIDPADGLLVAEAQERTGRVVMVGYMKRFDDAYAAMAVELADGPVPRYLDVVTWDPWMAGAPYFLPGEIVAASAPDAAAAEQIRAQTLEQARRATGVDDLARLREYLFPYLSCTVHDVNLVHGLLEAAGAAAPRPVASRCWADGEAATTTLDLGGGAVASLTWLLMRGGNEYREVVRAFLPDGVASLSFPAPYAKQNAATYERRRAAGEGHAVTRFSSVGDSYVKELQHFHDCVAHDVVCATPPRQALADVTLVRDLFLLAAERNAVGA